MGLSSYSAFLVMSYSHNSSRTPLFYIIYINIYKIIHKNLIRKDTALGAMWAAVLLKETAIFRPVLKSLK